MSDLILAFGVIFLILAVTAAFLKMKTRAMIGQSVASDQLLRQLPETGAAMLFFYTPSCSVCKQMEPALAELEVEGRAVMRVDISRSPELTARFKVMAAPTMVLVKNGIITGYEVGFRNKIKLVSLLID